MTAPERYWRDLLAVFEAEAAKRSERRGWAGHEPVWVHIERDAMTDRVNLLRSRLGKPPVTCREVERAERTAIGHFDYGVKWALACEELVLS